MKSTVCLLTLVLSLAAAAQNKTYSNLDDMPNDIAEMQG